MIYFMTYFKEYKSAGYRVLDCEVKSRKATSCKFEPSAIEQQFHTTLIDSLCRKNELLCSLIAFQCDELLSTTKTPAPLLTYIPTSRWVLQLKHPHLPALFSVSRCLFRVSPVFLSIFCQIENPLKIVHQRIHYRYICETELTVCDRISDARFDYTCIHTNRVFNALVQGKVYHNTSN